MVVFERWLSILEYEWFMRKLSISNIFVTFNLHFIHSMVIITTSYLNGVNWFTKGIKLHDGQNNEKSMRFAQHYLKISFRWIEINLTRFFERIPPLPRLFGIGEYPLIKILATVSAVLTRWTTFCIHTILLSNI